MSEQDYINGGNVARLRGALDLLHVVLLEGEREEKRRKAISGLTDILNDIFQEINQEEGDE